jgi:hypothetical protein
MREMLYYGIREMAGIYGEKTRLCGFSSGVDKWH